MERWQRSLAANKRETQKEMIILSPEELNVLKSGYVDVFDYALDILESAWQLKPPD